MSLSAFFSARSIAIVGASDDPERIGGRPLAYLKDSWSNKDRVVYPINPSRAEVQGVRSYPSIAAIGKPVDLALIAVPAAKVEDAIADCVRGGCKGAIILSSGFGELGEDGKRRQQRIHDLALSAGMRLLGPNCLGVVDLAQRLYATFTEAARDRRHTVGSISVASQSGAVAMQLLTLSRRVGVGMNKLISTGNEQDVDVAECISYLATDPSTKVIVAYLEGCKDGHRLTEALLLARAHAKPVIIVKVGRSVSGSRATLSHTGSLAGEDRIYDAVFQQYGAYRADSFDEAMDVAMMCASTGPAGGNRIGLISVSGGVGALMADAAEGLGLNVAPIPDSAAAQGLQKLLSFSTLQNPLDITAQAINDMSLFRKNLETMLSGGGYDVIVAFMTFIGESPRMFGPVMASMVEARSAHPDIPIIFCSLCTPEARSRAVENGFVVFEDAVRAVRAVAGWSKLTGQRSGEPQHFGGGEVRADKTEAANEFAAKQILARAGIGIPREQLVRSKEQAIAAANEIGFPVVLKICSSDLPHKTEVGGVALDLRDVGMVSDAYDRIIESVSRHAPTAGIEGVIVAEQIGAGVEMIVGAQRDPLFGTVVMLGFGGILVEVLRDVSLRLAPLAEADVDEMVKALRAKALLAGVRGGPPADVDALKDAVIRFARLAANSSARSIEINPLLVRPSGQGVVALDCLIESSTEVSQ
jgi:acyl-CoA synthetase (NDP forming)